MIHSYEGFERTLAGPELVPVLVVRVPVMSAEQKAGLRAEIASSILDGLLLLEDGLAYQVVDLPLPREWTPLLQEEPEPEPPRPTGAECGGEAGDPGAAPEIPAEARVGLLRGPSQGVRGGCDRDHSPQPVPWR